MSARPEDFAPLLLRMRDAPPPPLAGWMLRLVVTLLACVAAWGMFGRLDIVAVADGKLVPASYLKILQPAEQGIVKEILVREGERVKAGQVLIRMDNVVSDADVTSLRTDLHQKRISLERIDAQLAGRAMARAAQQPEDVYARIAAQQAANVRAQENAIAQERSVLEKARSDLAAAEQTRTKLEQVLPHYMEQERAFEKLAKDGFAGRLLATDKTRERIEREQDLNTQRHVIRSTLAVIAQSEKRLVQIDADYRRVLQAERVEIATQVDRLGQELAKHEHRQKLLELRAPAGGIVKDLATHTAGTVAGPGTVLMTLVPQDEKLVAEVWVGNQDVGFVASGQTVKVKLVPYQFQKYGMIEGKVVRVSADATEAPSANTRSDALSGRDRPMGPLAYRALVELVSQELNAQGNRHALSPGMQVAAEIHLGTRTVMEYLMSPVRKAFHEAARER